MGHWFQTCYELNGYPVGHPKAKFNPGSRGFHNRAKPAVNNVAESSWARPAVNHVAESPSKVDGSQFIGISKDQLKQLLSLVSKNDDSISQANAVPKSGLSKITSRNWIIDSGATDHISSSSKLFRKNKSCSLHSVMLPSGDKVNIVAKGSLPLNSVYYLHNVLCVPTFKVDLISVSHLMRGLNCSITFFLYWCILQDLATRRMIGLGKQRDGLYYLTALVTNKTVNTSSPPTKQPTCNLTISSTDLWHHRLGHASSPCLSFIAKNF